MILRQLEHIMLSQTFTAITRSSTLQSMRCSSITPLFTSSRRLRTFSTMITRSCKKMESESFVFGPYKIDPKEVFYSTTLSYAMVNLRPLLPGHVLVCPRREVKRFADLTGDETCDLWLTAQKIGSKLEHYHKASSLTLAIQDGPQAGQTVPHVHIHIIPRKTGDFEKNDEIYDAIDVKEKELAEKLDLDKERKDRTLEEMNQEAEEYRALFK
ncbi:bifunctional bis(5'-adenosyl)-triphosphatase/adenylylsulfatase FHIT-like isoform X1 [Chenopodium quinoa]|uniref:bifunctional bis(5'-adenosyl)-triphosphatase/adenylylsulfatase FHIT-like isoform X1 n=2 Tax=Chenopodium quinoa TaxID=63459 RepID=UPI000B77D056|nr:bifunctional bis(5'-adenosyl)-triphosphatase/adenylylsulfatase FHIT-like isoform X1 [Chenopodium quinoa]